MVSLIRSNTFTPFRVSFSTFMSSDKRGKKYYCMQAKRKNMYEKKNWNMHCIVYVNDDVIPQQGKNN